MNEKDLEAVSTENLDTALEEFRVEICRALLSVPLDGVRHVDIVFHMSASGTIPDFSIRRVLSDSDVESQHLYNNVERVVRYDAEKLKEIRRETNNE